MAIFIYFAEIRDFAEIQPTPIPQSILREVTFWISLLGYPEDNLRVTLLG